MRHALLAFVLLLALPSRAQLVTASLTGRVTVSDAPAAGVTVTVTSAVLQHPRSTLTNARGTYWLDALPHGEYDVTFSRAGLTSLTRRAVLQTARLARADATLEVSEDEETVTSTATTPSVVDTTAVTTHFDPDTLDRLPVRRELFPVASVAPPLGPAVPYVDDVYLESPNLIPEDALDEVTVVRGAAPVELDRPSIVARTRAPRERFFLTLRDTLTSTRWMDDRFRTGFTQSDEIEHHVDLTAGGRIVPNLWFFGAGWLGDEADAIRYDQRGTLLKLTASPHASHTFNASYLDAESSFAGITGDDAAATTLRYTGIFGPHITTELQASRSPIYNFAAETEHVDTIAARSSLFLGDHALTLGGHRSGFSNGGEVWSLFAADRISIARWTLSAGVRHQDSGFDAMTMPRLAASYDVRGNARHALTASYGEYLQAFDAIRVAAVGYVYAFAANGYARADVLRREDRDSDIFETRLEGRYRLFDRFEAGGNYSYVALDFFGDQQRANAWIGLELPFGEHELGITVLQRLFHGEFAGSRPRSETVTPTDLAVRYSLPLGNTHLTLAADWTNALAVSIGQVEGRSLRFWARLRI